MSIEQYQEKLEEMARELTPTKLISRESPELGTDAESEARQSAIAEAVDAFDSRGEVT